MLAATPLLIAQQWQRSALADGLSTGSHWCLPLPDKTSACLSSSFYSAGGYLTASIRGTQGCWAEPSSILTLCPISAGRREQAVLSPGEVQMSNFSSVQRRVPAPLSPRKQFPRWERSAEPSRTMLQGWVASSNWKAAGSNLLGQVCLTSLSLQHGMDQCVGLNILWKKGAQGVPRLKLRMVVSKLRSLPRCRVKEWLEVQIPDTCCLNDVLTVSAKQHCITGCFTYFLSCGLDIKEQPEVVEHNVD